MVVYDRKSVMVVYDRMVMMMLSNTTITHWLHCDCMCVASVDVLQLCCLTVSLGNFRNCGDVAAACINVIWMENIIKLQVNMMHMHVRARMSLVTVAIFEKPTDYIFIIYIPNEATLVASSAISEYQAGSMDLIILIIFLILSTSCPSRLPIHSHNHVTWTCLVSANQLLPHQVLSPHRQ